jgi:hypothetical protein
MGCVIQETRSITFWSTIMCRTYKWSRLMLIHVYFRSIGDRLIRFSGIYVDDLLRCGIPDFFGIRKKLLGI